MNEKGTRGAGRNIVKNNRCECGRWVRNGGTKCSLCRKKETPSLYKTNECSCGGIKSIDAARCRKCMIEHNKTKTRFCGKCGTELNSNNWNKCDQKTHSNICRSCDNSKQRDLNDKNEKKNEIKRYKVKAETMAAYGGKCACCGESETAFLTIDHKFENGAAHRKTAGRRFVFYTWLRKQGYPQDEYQCLCMNCNFAKSKNPGGCPHRLTKDQVMSESCESDKIFYECEICDIKFRTSTGLGNHNNRYHSGKVYHADAVERQRLIQTESVV